eukprot:11263536-Ditylum_brightwellii.AAC.1
MIRKEGLFLSHPSHLSGIFQNKIHHPTLASPSDLRENDTALAMSGDQSDASSEGADTEGVDAVAEGVIPLYKTAP